MNDELIRALIDRADQALEDAHYLLFERRSFESAVSRAYYAMYYATEACLLSVDERVSSHKGLITQFGRRFVKEGIIEVTYGQMLSTIYQKRQLGDYEISYTLSEAETSEAITNASAFVERVKMYLQA